MTHENLLIALAKNRPEDGTVGYSPVLFLHILQIIRLNDHVFPWLQPPQNFMPILFSSPMYSVNPFH
jgi:hypothetical protein